MSNPLLTNAKLPGRIFQLPSKGLFYNKGVLSPHITNAEIQVQPLSAMAEMKLRSPDLLFSGRAIREICEECIPDILQPDLLIAKDIDAIFCFLRIVTYGSNMTIQVNHDCESAQLHDYIINLDEIIMNPNNTCLDHKDVLYRVKLPTGHIVNLKPVTFFDSLEVIHLRQNMYTTANASTGSPPGDLVQNVALRDLQSIIASVETSVTESGETKQLLITDQTMIRDWLKTIQRTSLDMILAQSIEANKWGFNLQTKLVCRDCNKSFDYDLELDPISFFSG